MDKIWQNIRELLDAIYFHVIAPFFGISSRGLEFLILKPLNFLGFPPFLQVAVIGLMVGSVSVYTKRLLRVEEKEEAFRKAFAAKKAEQENFKLLDDWKAKKLLYETSDQELDEMYNTYISQRFAWFGMVYLLPIFLSLYWLDNEFSAERLIDLHGSPFVMPLPDNPLGLPGLSVPLVFLIFYLFPVLLFKRLFRRHTPSHSRESTSLS